MQNNWETPDNLVLFVSKEVMNKSDLYDPCPFLDGEGVREVGGVKIYSNSNKLGLDRNHPWGEFNIVNPPYDNIQAWIDRAHYEAENHEKFSCLILPAYTDRKWFDSVNVSRCVFLPRINFIPLEGQKTSGSRFGVLLYCTGWVPETSKKLRARYKNSYRTL